MDQNQFRPLFMPVQAPVMDQENAETGIKRLRGIGQACSNAKSEIPAQDNSRSVVPTVPWPSMSFRPIIRPDVFRYHGGGSPLPTLQWADREEVWNMMCWKEKIYLREPNLFQLHPEMTPRMRAVLYEWLSEVCEVYKLHRETFYLCMDIVDRYLSVQRNLPKNDLQLIGITALFVAAKIEEIYPPQVKDFAYVTDKACTVEAILELELRMLKALNWALSPVTINGWLLVYLQVVANEANRHIRTSAYDMRPRDFLMPQFQRLHYIRLMQLTDLCSLDPMALGFSYSMIAASAFFHMLQPHDLTWVVSGYTWTDLAPCIKWMAPFAEVVKECEFNVKYFPDIRHDDMHNIQVHFVGMKLLEKAQQLAIRFAQFTQEISSPPGHTNPEYSIFPTPPRSDERPAPVSRLLQPGYGAFRSQNQQNFEFRL